MAIKANIQLPPKNQFNLSSFFLKLAKPLVARTKVLVMPKMGKLTAENLTAVAK